MPRHTAFHPRTAASCESFAWKEWAGYAAVCHYEPHSEQEYFAMRNAAGLLDVSPHTVGTYVKRLYEKLQVRSRGEAVFEAQRMGLLS